MRGSKAKKLRKFAHKRVAPQAPLQTIYNPLKPFMVFGPLINPADPADGKRHQVQHPGHVSMAFCLRKVYQDVKKRYRHANHIERFMAKGFYV